MAQTPGVSSLTVSEMAWPGTHDSGANSYTALESSYLIPGHMLTSTQQWRLFAQSNFTILPMSGITPPEIRQLLRNLTINHPGQSIYDQLKNGARYLDLRIARSSTSTDKTFYLVHTFVVGHLSNALEDILRFMNEHRGEVVIIKVQPKFRINTYNETTEVLDYVFNFASSSGLKIQDFAFIKRLSQGTNFSQCGTIGDLVSSNRRLLLTYDTSDATVSPLPIDNWSFFREAFYVDQWMPALTADAKHNILLADINRLHTSPNNGRLYNVQFILTPPRPPPNQYFPVGAPSLEQLANEMNPTLESFVFTMMNESVRSFTNIYTTDFSYEYRYEINAVMRRLIAERIASKATDAPDTTSVAPTTATASVVVVSCALLVLNALL